MLKFSKYRKSRVLARGASFLLLTLLASVLVFKVFPRLGIIANSDTQLGVNMVQFLKTGFYVWNDLVNGGNKFAFPTLQNSAFQSFFNLFGLNYTNAGIITLFFIALIFTVYKLTVFLLGPKEKIQKASVFIIAFTLVSSRVVLNMLIANVSVLWSFLFIYLGMLFFVQYYEYGGKKKLFWLIISLSLCLIDLHSAILLVMFTLGYFLFDVLATLIFLKDKEQSKKRIKRIISFYFISFLLNSYWLLNYIYTFFKERAPAQEFANFFATADLVKEYVNDFYNFLSYNFILTRPIWFESKYDLKSPLFVESLVSYLILILAIASILFIKKEADNRKKKTLLIFYLFLPLLFSLSFGPKNPFKVFDLLWNYLPGFHLFRDFFKFQRLILPIMTILSGFTVVKVIEKYKFGKKLMIGFALLTLVKIFPYINFREFYKPFKIPDYYYSLGKFSDETKQVFSYQIFPLISWMQKYQWSNKFYDMTDPVGYFTPPKTAYYNKVVYEEDTQQKVNKQIFSYFIDGEEDLFAKTIALRNVGYVVIRRDLSSEYVQRAIEGGQGKFHEAEKMVLSAETNKFLFHDRNFGLLNMYKVKPEYFFPIVNTNNLVYTSEKVDKLAQIMKTDDYEAGKGICFGGETWSNKMNNEVDNIADYAEKIIIYGKKEGGINARDIKNINYPEEKTFTKGDVKWKPGTFFYNFALKLDDFDIWLTRNDDKKTLVKYLIHSSKRVAEIQDVDSIWEMNKNLNSLMNLYEEDIGNVIKILMSLKNLNDVDSDFFFNKVKGIILRQEERIGQLDTHNKKTRDIFTKVFERLFGEMDKINPIEDPVRPAYEFNLPVAGEYDIFTKGGVKENWTYLKTTYFEKGRQALIFDAVEENKNLLDDNMKITGYLPNETYKLTFEYKESKRGTLAVTEGKLGRLIEKKLPPSGSNFKKISLYFISSSEAEKATVFISIDEYRNLKIERVSPQEIVAIKKNNLMREFPMTEFRKINPTKFRIVLHRAKEAFPLFFNENYSPDWKLYLKKNDFKENLLPKKVSSDEKITFLNTGQENAANSEDVLTFANNNWISSINLEKGTELKYISRNLHRTIQNDNLPSGFFWETWKFLPFNNKTLAVGDQSHILVNNGTNSWLINAEALCLGRNESFCQKNNDGTYEMEFILEYFPQRLSYLGLVVSFLTVIGGLGYILFQSLRSYNRFAKTPHFSAGGEGKARLSKAKSDRLQASPGNNRKAVESFI